MNDQEWHIWRAGGAGASDVANAVHSTYGGAYAVVAEKLGAHRDETNADRKKLGHEWENRLADVVHALTGYYVVGEQAWCEHPDNPIYRCTSDGFVARVPEATLDDVVGMCEFKIRHPGSGNLEARYRTQVQYQLLVTGLAVGLIVEATIPDDVDLDQLELKDIRLRFIDVHADPFEQQMLAGVADWLWAHVQAGTYPDPDSPDALDAVKARFATAVTEDEEKALEPVDLTELVDLIARRDDIKAAAKQADDELKLIDAKVREAMGHRRRGVAPGWSVSLSAPTRVLTDNAEQAFLQVHPDCVKTVFDRHAAEAIDKKWLDELREQVGHRTLRITRKANQ